jgi:hypothetical protein
VKKKRKKRKKSREKTMARPRLANANDGQKWAEKPNDSVVTGASTFVDSVSFSFPFFLFF